MRPTFHTTSCGYANKLHSIPLWRIMPRSLKESSPYRAPDFHPQPCFTFAFPDWGDKGSPKFTAPGTRSQASNDGTPRVGSSFLRAHIHCKESKYLLEPSDPGPTPHFPGASRHRMISCVSVLAMRSVPVIRIDWRLSGHRLHPHLTSHPGLLSSVGSRKGNLIWENPAGSSNKAPHLTSCHTLASSPNNSYL